MPILRWLTLKTEILQLECLQNLRGAGSTPDFKWQGWLNGAKNQNPEKSLGPAAKPKTIHAEFPSHKNFKWYNKRNRNRSFEYPQKILWSSL